MSLTVLSVAFWLTALGPGSVGGAEQILSQIDAALVRPVAGAESLGSGARAGVLSDDSGGSLTPPRDALSPAGWCAHVCTGMQNSLKQARTSTALKT